MQTNKQNLLHMLLLCSSTNTDILLCFFSRTLPWYVPRPVLLLSSPSLGQHDDEQQQQCCCHWPCFPPSSLVLTHPMKMQQLPLCCCHPCILHIHASVRICTDNESVHVCTLACTCPPPLSELPPAKTNGNTICICICILFLHVLARRQYPWV